MHSLKTEYKIDVINTINGIDPHDFLKEIAEVCHLGIESISMTRQDCDENPCLNTAKTWKEQCEEIEGFLCRILNHLGD